MIEKIEDNELMKSFYNMIPYLCHFLGEDVGVSITNKEKYLLVKNGEKAKIPAKTGDKFPPGCAADVCMKKKKKINFIVPKEVFGTAVKTIAVPIFVNNEVEGAIVIGLCIDSIEKITSLSNILSKSLDQISINTMDIATKFQEIAKTNQQIDEYIHKTSEQAKKTDEVLNFVDGIAKQTNLLGLNAAIESARAGEYGKGFSVVSSEIRKLSQSTKESVEAIGGILNTIQNSIYSIEKSFESSNDLIATQSADLEEISSTIEELTSNAQVLKELANSHMNV